jgi:hypothetical protein
MRGDILLILCVMVGSVGIGLSGWLVALLGIGWWRYGSVAVESDERECLRYWGRVEAMAVVYVSMKLGCLGVQRQSSMLSRCIVCDFKR